MWTERVIACRSFRMFNPFFAFDVFVGFIRAAYGTESIVYSALLSYTVASRIPQFCIFVRLSPRKLNVKLKKFST